MNSNDLEKFMNNVGDFGKLPPDFEMTVEQKKLAVLAMAINAAIVQFINEGLFPHGQQLHFMGHLQDFANRLNNGESVNMPHTKQTLQVNSKAGTLFYQATENALVEGSANFSKIQEFSKEVLARQETSDEPEGDPDLSKSRILN